MSALKINNIIFNNPIMVASGTYGYGDEVSDFVDLSKFGALITKSVTRNPREGNPPPRIFEVNSGMLNSIGLANLGVERYVEEKIPQLNKIKTNIIINIAGTRIDDYIETLEILESANSKHVGYEINISCPNVKEGGMDFGVSPDMTKKLTKELRSRTDKLLIMKLTPNVTSIVEIGLAAQRGGADAVSAINTVSGMRVDIQSKKPMLSTIIGGLSGPAIKPIAIANVFRLFKNIDIPIIGIGGISNSDDVIEFLISGASFVQLGTINYKHPNLINGLMDEIENYLKNNSTQTITDLIGKIDV